MAILLGAFAAHGLKPVFSEYQLDIWQTAMFYHLVHSVVMLVVCLANFDSALEKVRKLSLLLFALGIVLFSGSLYALALTEVKVLGAITPLGGICLVLGWLNLSRCAFNSQTN